VSDPDETQTRARDADFAALWSSDGVTRSFAPTATGVPADLPFLFGPDQQFGPYKIIRPIGKGGMGQVYEAEELDSGRRIALKLLSRGLGDDEDRERFLSEGRLAASLSHPNCVYVFGTSEIQGFPVIAMELVPQGTLKDLVVPGAPMSAAAAADAILQVIAGLDAAAAIGILHRDIKPSNCFVHRNGRVLVGDFGLSVAASGHGTSSRTVLGTPGFASPEQLRGDSLDVRSDIYSVGATLFYLLAGRPPFDDRSTTDLLAKVAAQPAPSLSTLRPDVPRRLAQVASRCLAKLRQDVGRVRALGAHAVRVTVSTEYELDRPLVNRDGEPLGFVRGHFQRGTCRFDRLSFRVALHTGAHRQHAHVLHEQLRDLAAAIRANVHENIHAAVGLNESAHTGDIVDAQSHRALARRDLDFDPGSRPTRRQSAGNEWFALEHRDARDAPDEGVGVGIRAGRNRRDGPLANGERRAIDRRPLGDALRRDDQRTGRDPAGRLGVLEDSIDTERRQGGDRDGNVEDEGIASASHGVTWLTAGRG